MAEGSLSTSPKEGRTPAGRAVCLELSDSFVVAVIVHLFFFPREAGEMEFWNFMILVFCSNLKRKMQLGKRKPLCGFGHK